MLLTFAASFVALCVGFLLIGIAAVKEAFWPARDAEGDLINRDHCQCRTCRGAR